MRVLEAERMADLVQQRAHPDRVAAVVVERAVGHRSADPVIVALIDPVLL